MVMSVAFDLSQNCHLVISTDSIQDQEIAEW